MLAWICNPESSTVLISCTLTVKEVSLDWQLAPYGYLKKFKFTDIHRSAADATLMNVTPCTNWCPTTPVGDAWQKAVKKLFKKTRKASVRCSLYWHFLSFKFFRQEQAAFFRHMDLPSWEVRHQSIRVWKFDLVWQAEKQRLFTF